MKWSQLKKRIEATFAKSVAGRVEVWNTRYRGAHDDAGEAWITVDGVRVTSMGACTFGRMYWEESWKLRQDGYCRTRDEAVRRAHERGGFLPSEVNRALFDYLSLSIDDAIKSDNPIIRAFATLDRRFGKRRLAEFDDSKEHPLVRTLYRIRCGAEGIAERKPSA